MLFECDNSSVVAALSNDMTKDDVVMHLAHYDTEFPKHIPGVVNCTADHLS